MYPSDYRYQRNMSGSKFPAARARSELPTTRSMSSAMSCCRTPAVVRNCGGKIIRHDRIRQGGQRTLRPVSGEVLETNTALSNAPETVNSDPHGAAWLIKIKLANPAEVSGLMDAAAYQAFISERKPQPDALSSKESSRAPRNARVHRRAIH